MFVQVPNLPDSDAAIAAVSDTYPEIAEALRNRGIRTIEISPFPQLSRPVCSHADMVLHHLGENQVILAAGNRALELELKQAGFEVTVSNVCISNRYPQDVRMNAARVGDKLFAKQSALAPEILRYCEQHRISVIAVNQGYAKCSTVVVNERSVMTEDPSIAKVARSIGMEVLKISAGYVKLPGYSYGFLGGACGMIGKNRLAFTGALDSHPDSKQIICFCRSRHVEPVALTKGPLVDIGGILTLKTKCGEEKPA
ncbi:MAG: hypothetical protein GX424_09330 [Clostridiales bacterium]|jgi:hypothetical protein|nr:hypothetical protein [Clostridiales bacterium]